MDCIFCKIANKEVAKNFINETPNVMVFEDIHPRAPVHILVVPKKHVREFTGVLETDKPIFNEMLSVIVKMILQFGLNQKGYRLVTNGGGAQLIDHFHIHVMGGITPDRGL